MSIKLSRGIFFGAAAVVATFGLAFSAAAQDYSYDSGEHGKASYGEGMSTDGASRGAMSRGDLSASASSYGYDASAVVGGVTVIAPRRVEHTASGAEIVIASASRVVNTRDLDLSSEAGMHELHSRVSAAAYDACGQLDAGALGMAPLDSDADCQSRAVDDAMAQVNAPQ